MPKVLRFPIASCFWLGSVLLLSESLISQQPSLIAAPYPQSNSNGPESGLSRKNNASERSLEELQKVTDELTRQVTELKAEQGKANEEEAQKKAKSDEKPSFNIGGQLVMDMLWFTQDADSIAAVGDADDVFDVRRARIYMNGELWHTWYYAMGFDFGQGSGENGRPAFVDNFIGIKDLPVLGNFRIGHFFEPFTLERSGSNRNTMFMERSLPDMFAPSRNIGFMIHNHSDDDLFWWGIGSFRGITDNFSDDSGDQMGQTIDIRWVYRPGYNTQKSEQYLHLGATYSFRDAADGQLRYRTRPELSGNEDPDHPATPYFIDTGNLAAENSQLWGGEMLWTNGPLSVQSEIVASPVNLSSGQDVMFTGAYASIAYFLTGEYIPYNAELAITDRVHPHAPVFRRRSKDAHLETGPGAWQIAARLSYADLDDAPVGGGKLTNTTFGLNWFLTPYHRMKFNYILSDLDRYARSTKANLFGLRFDMDF